MQQILLEKVADQLAVKVQAIEQGQIHPNKKMR